MQSSCTNTFEVNKSFRKKVVLPPIHKWKVSEEDTLVSGAVQSIIRTKGLFFKHCSATLRRHATVTKQGFMIVYSGETEGYVMDLKTALRVKANIGFSKGAKQTRLCRIEVKMAFGTFCMIIAGPDAEKWLSALNTIILSNKKTTVTTEEQSTLGSITETSEVPTAAETNPSNQALYEEEGVLSCTEKAEPSFFEESDNTLMPMEDFSFQSQNSTEFLMPVSIVVPLEDPTSSTRSKSPVTVIERKPVMPTKEEIALWRRPAMYIPPSVLESEDEPKTEQSVRFGPLSVATLRHKLESKARCSFRKSRKDRHPTMLNHPLIPKQEETPQVEVPKKEEPKEVPKKETVTRIPKPRLIAKKASSAPAAFPSAAPSSSRKTLAKIGYDGCFDSIHM